MYVKKPDLEKLLQPPKQAQRYPDFGETKASPLEGLAPELVESMLREGVDAKSAE